MEFHKSEESGIKVLSHAHIWSSKGTTGRHINFNRSCLDNVQLKTHNREERKEDNNYSSWKTFRSKLQSKLFGTREKYPSYSRNLERANKSLKTLTFKLALEQYTWLLSLDRRKVYKTSRKAHTELHEL